MGSLPKTGFIRRFQLAKALGIHVTTIDRWVNDGKLPAPVKPGEKVTAFKAEEIQDWLKSKSVKDESEW
ncbi:helix-turn-helix domain-containing protein [Pantoea piersonii]|uniref:Helix-turn-helix domain-containing protein n=2 Tax=Pantoea piersonii TaxID=2364647 RepID=A0AAJ5QPX4_9GAMM|nr:helix-turn-helix domain-containing protein [Pantoea piersonii]